MVKAHYNILITIVTLLTLAIIILGIKYMVIDKSVIILTECVATGNIIDEESNIALAKVHECKNHDVYIKNLEIVVE